MRVEIVYLLYSLASILISSTENCLIVFSSIEQRRTVCSKNPLSLTAIYGLQTFSREKRKFAEKWSKKYFRSCDGNSGFSHDLIFVEVSEWDDFVWFIIFSVCKLFGS